MHRGFSIMQNDRQLHSRLARRKASGFALVEVLVAIALLAITALSVARSTIIAYNTMARNEYRAAAVQLAKEKLEELAAQSPVTLNDAQDQLETNVTFGKMKFSRTTNVTVNNDNSRTISVTVTGLNSQLGGTVTLQDSFALWGTM